MIVIIDYGMGNVGSIFNMLNKIGCRATISADIDEMMKADKLIDSQRSYKPVTNSRLRRHIGSFLGD